MARDAVTVTERIGQSFALYVHGSGRVLTKGACRRGDDERRASSMRVGAVVTGDSGWRVTL